METADLVVAILGALSAFAGFLAMVAGIISNTSKFKDWNSKRVKRDINLNILADNVEIIQSLISQQESIEEALRRLEEVEDRLRRVMADNKRQDKQIRNSLYERKLFMIGLMSILDWAILNGANDAVIEARERLRDYQYHAIHDFERRE